MGGDGRVRRRREGWGVEGEGGRSGDGRGEYASLALGDGRHWSDLHQIWYADTSCLHNLQNMSKSKQEVNSTWRRRPYWISVLSQYLGRRIADHPILTKFGAPTQILTSLKKIYPKFEFFKIQDGGWKPS